MNKENTAKTKAMLLEIQIKENTESIREIHRMYEKIIKATIQNEPYCTKIGFKAYVLSVDAYSAEIIVISQNFLKKPNLVFGVIDPIST